LNDDSTRLLTIARALEERVLASIKSAFVGKDEIIDLMGVCLVAGENLFILGPPGTAKSALVHELGRRIEGQTFEYLLTRFTEPNELFGPFDIRRLKEGELVTNTEGMLPEASLVFLDELLNANSAILNSLLTALNERVFRRGRETRPLPALMFVGASNRLPEDESLRALFDRFLVRAVSTNVRDDQLPAVLEAGWRLAAGETAPATIASADLRALARLTYAVDLSPARGVYLELVRSLRHAGIALSDRRAVRLQRLIAASAVLCGRLAAIASDCWILRHCWDTEEQIEVVAGIVDDMLERQQKEAATHPQASLRSEPDAQALGRELAAIATEVRTLGTGPSSQRAILSDRLAGLAERVQWVRNVESRAQLQQDAEKLWPELGGAK
jgi:MoxR-like ATPase